MYCWLLTIYTTNNVPTEEDVDDINVDFYVKHGVIPIYGNSVDLCKFPVNLACPLKAGPGFVVIEYPIPQFENVVSYILYIIQKQLWCFNYILYRLSYFQVKRAY